VSLEMALPLAGDAAGGTYPARSRAWARGCSQGRSLADQLIDEPSTARALIAAGEHTGRLPEVCTAMAELTDQACQIRRDLLGRLWYPGLLLHAVLILPGLPGLIQGTTSLVGLFLGPLIVWAVLGGGFVAWHHGRTSGVLTRIALWGPIRWLTLPLFGQRLCLVAGAAHAAGLLHRQALALAAAACGNRHLEAALEVAGRDLEAQRLSGMAEALAQAGLDPTTVALVQAGEVSGCLSERLADAARHHQERFAARAQMTVRVVAGVIFAVMAVTVAVTVIGMYQHLYQQALGSLDSEA